jgi:hypothetical protein
VILKGSKPLSDTQGIEAFELIADTLSDTQGIPLSCRTIQGTASPKPLTASYTSYTNKRFDPRIDCTKRSWQGDASTGKGRFDWQGNASTGKARSNHNVTLSAEGSHRLSATVWQCFH